jgi:hypothetical protein
MKVGFTGTRNGMTREQIARVRQALAQSWREGAEFHHGDCLGADAEAATHARDLGYRIVCHPPIDQSLRAFFPSDETRQPLTYFARNREIVKAVDQMLAAPPTIERQPRGGTWYTVDYADKIGRPLVIAPPDGSVETRRL